MVGFGLVWRAFRVIRENGMSYVYIIILGAAVLLFACGFGLSGFLGDWASGKLASVVSDATIGSEAHGWLTTVVEWATRAMTWVATLVMISIVGGCLILVVLSPMLSIVSDKTWVANGGTATSSNAGELVRSVGRGIYVAVKNGLTQAFLILIIFVVGFVPIIGVVAQLLTVAVNAFYFGTSFSDYAMERKKLTAKESIAVAHGNRGLMIGIGLPFTLAMMIPVVGSYVALLLAPATSAAGALAVGSDNFEA